MKSACLRARRIMLRGLHGDVAKKELPDEGWANAGSASHHGALATRFSLHDHALLIYEQETGSPRMEKFDYSESGATTMDKLCCITTVYTEPYGKPGMEIPA